MAQTQPNFDFLRVFIEELFDNSGFAQMSEADRAQFIPGFTAEAERRVGLAIMPRLSEDAQTQLAKLAAEDASAEELAKFWHAAVPDFDTVVADTLRAFAEEFKNTLKKIS